MLTRASLLVSGILAVGMATDLRGQCEQQLQKIVAPDGTAGRQFGYSVAVTGDWMVIGAPFANDPAPRSGAVYLYHRDGNGQWAFDRKLTLNEPADRFAGFSVAASSQHILFARLGACIGEWASSGGTWHDAGCYVPPNTGIVYADRVGASESMTWWTTGTAVAVMDNEYTAPVRATIGPSPTFASGASVAVSASPLLSAVDGAGRTIAGAGVAYSAQRYSGGFWLFGSSTIQALDPAINSYFGSSVAARGHTAVFGAYNAPSTDQPGRGGAAYVFDYLPGTAWWTQSAKLAAQDWQVGDLFGFQVALDEYGDHLAVTAPWKDADTGVWDAGCVYVFTRDSESRWSQSRQFFATDARTDGQMGMSLVYTGGHLFAGAPGDSQQGDSAGAVYVFSVDPQRPSIDNGPNTAIVRVGQTAFFDISASGNGTMTYQWRRNGLALSDGGKIAGSRTAHLRIRNCHWADTAFFDCVVANGCDSTTSRTADLVVQCPADFNDDSFLDFFDYDDFIVAFEQGDPRADFNRDDFIDFFDYDDFVSAFEAGC